MVSWIGEFCFRKGKLLNISCAQIGNEIFCVVDRPFIEDEFNLKGLSKYVPNMRNALCTILDLVQPGIVGSIKSRR